jgi:hypothetical protein
MARGRHSFEKKAQMSCKFQEIKKKILRFEISKASKMVA